MVLVEYVPLDDLRPYPGNPRKISAKGLEKLKRSLQEFGFINPIIAQRNTGMIIAGHQRYKAAKALGIKEVPVLWWDTDDETAKAYCIADNKLAEESEWDFTPLADLLSELDSGAFDITLTGFELPELREIAEYTPEPRERKTNICPNCGHEY